MPKTNKKNASRKRNKVRKPVKTSLRRGQQSSHPLGLSITPTLPEYIAPTGIAASIGRFLGSLGKPKR